jgi:hypothetical protein
LNNKKNIEDLLKDKLEQQEFDIQDKWMDEMSSMLDDYNDEPKSKKGFLFILTGLVLLIGLIGTLFVLKSDSVFKKEAISTTEINQENKNAQLSKKITSKMQHSTIQDIPVEEDCVDEIPIINSTIPYEENVLVKGENSSIKPTTKANITKQVSMANNNPKASKKGISRTAKKNNKTRVYKKQLGQQVNFKNNKNKETEKANASNKLSKDNTNTLVLEGTVITEEKNQFAQNYSSLSNTKNEVIINSSEKILITEKTPTNLLKTKTIENKIQKNKAQTIELNSNKIKINNDSIISQKEPKLVLLEDSIIEETILELIEDSLVKEETIVTNTKKKDLGLSVSATAGVSFLFRDFDSENKKRVQEESSKIGWNAQLAIYKTFKNRIILGTGISLSNYGEKVDYLTEKIGIKDTLTTVKEYTYINLNLKRVQGAYSFDSTSFTQFDTTKTYIDSTYINEAVTKENGSTNFIYIEIPVKIGYKILDSKKLSINAMTGVSFGFLLQNKGFYADKEHNLIAAQSQKVIFNYLLSADFIYKINEHINLTLSPHFKYNLNNLSRINATKRKYSTFGINGGVILDF